MWSTIIFIQGARVLESKGETFNFKKGRNVLEIQNKNCGLSGILSTQQLLFPSVVISSSIFVLPFVLYIEKKNKT